MAGEIDLFERCVEFVLAHEGGLHDDPDDPGGVTNFGIAQKYNDGVDVYNLTREGAKEIYRRKYWEPSGASLLQWPECLAVMDTAANLGPEKARQWAASHGPWPGMLFARLHHYSQSKNTKFIRGWVARVVDVWREGCSD